MKNIQRHILSGLMLVLLLAYSLPVHALHHCARFEHSHQELCIEEAHPHCALCDLRIESFEQTPLILPLSPSFSDGSTLSAEPRTTEADYSGYKLNKGPPALY